MIHGSLFSGIGGFDLAAEWCGWTNAFHCEWAEFPRRVLRYHFPNAISYDDIRATDFRPWRGRIDVLSGGFPCQPFSSAGKRKGAEDDRYLWPEMLRAIDEIRPTWVVGENVAGLLSMVQPSKVVRVEDKASLFDEDEEDLTTEQSEFVIETICRDFERLGYSIQPIVVPACAVGAPHRRDRIWFIANSEGSRSTRECECGQGEVQPIGRGSEEVQSRCAKFPTQPPICGGDDGLPRELDSITFPRWRAESIKAYGNAIVPQVAYEIFKGINTNRNK